MNSVNWLSTVALALAAVLLAACIGEAEPNPAPSAATSAPGSATDPTMASDSDPTPASASAGGDAPSARTELATLGAGCFWCIEAVLEQADGVHDVRSGYMGGHVEDPSYRQVCTGETGHAEVVQVRFDPDVLSYEALLKWFWQAHDPTQLNRQGPDEGTQYRSVIFYHSERQHEIAERSKREEDASGRHLEPIVTEISPASTFYEAEDYHQDYYRNNKNAGYCRVMIAPKLEKLGLDK